MYKLYYKLYKLIFKQLLYSEIKREELMGNFAKVVCLKDFDSSEGFERVVLIQIASSLFVFSH